MKSLIRQGGLWALLLLAWLPDATAQSGARITSISVTNVGPAAVSENLVRANIHVKVGDVYVRASVDDDVLNLYKTGFFYNIEVTEHPEPGGVGLTYVLLGKPKLTGIKFEGNTKFSDEKLLKKVVSKIGDPVNEPRLFADAQEIEKAYEKAGYSSTKVKYVFNNFDQETGRSGVTFEITESPKIRIVGVDFVGARAFSESTLRGVIKTRRHWMFSWLTRHGTFKEEQFETDKETLTDYYRSRGYIDFEIRDIRITNPTPRTMQIVFVIYEGNPYKVGSVKFTGTNMLFTTAEIAAGLKLQHERNRSKVKLGDNGLEADVGLIFTPDALQHDEQALADLYGSRGYIELNQGGGLYVRATRVPNTEKGTMDLEYFIDSGDKSYIEKIEIKGNAKTKDKVIRRELAVSPGDTFDMVRVRLSKDRLEGLGFFEKVDTKIEQDPTLPTNRKNLIVGVDEKSTGQFTFGAGFNTVDSILGFAQIEQSNFDLFAPPYFTGGGQKFRLRVQLGAQRQDYLISFVEPWFLNRKLQFSVDLYRSVLNFQSLDSLYDETRTGARVGLTRALGSDFLIGGLTYDIEDIGIIHVSTNAPDTILRESGDTLLQRFGSSIAYDTRNNAMLPNKGQRTELTGSLAVGERTFYALELKTEWYFRGFAPGHVLELGAKMRVTDRISGQDVPFYDRSYLGGQYDLRGFDYRGVGPRQITQDGVSYEPIGGDSSWFASAEYSLPIISRLRFAMFYDIGNVSTRPYSVAGSDVIGKARPFFPGPALLPFQTFNAGNTGLYSDNWGFGLRLDLPIGPLRLDYGIPLKHDRFSSDGGKFQFSVGFTRPF